MSARFAVNSTTPLTMSLLSGDWKDAAVSALLKVLYLRTSTTPMISTVERVLHSKNA